MRLAGKVVVVTGAGSGLGQALALELLRRGARVAAVDLRSEGLQETMAKAGSLGEGLSLHPLDITDKEKVAALPEEVERVHGQVDGLINNAGIIQPFKRLLDLDEAAMERVMRVNFWGTLHMTRAFLPRLLKRPEAHLVNVSSMGAFVPVPGQALYGASKAAVMLTEALWAELQGTPVRVTLVLPGAMRTGIAEHSGVEAPRAEGAKVPVLGFRGGGQAPPGRRGTGRLPSAPGPGRPDHGPPLSLKPRPRRPDRPAAHGPPPHLTLPGSGRGKRQAP